MLHANARMQIDLMFAALIVLGRDGAGALLRRRRALRRAWCRWQPENLDR